MVGSMIRIFQGLANAEPRCGSQRVATGQRSATGGGIFQDGDRALSFYDLGKQTASSLGGPLCANMSETTLKFFKVEGTESSHDRERRQKS